MEAYAPTVHSADSTVHHGLPRNSTRYINAVANDGPLRQVVTGHFAYYAVPFRHYVADLWRRTLRRRSQKDGFTWERMTKLVADWLPAPRILHPWPDQRFAVKHPR